VRRKLADAFHASRLFSRVDSQPKRLGATYLIQGKILRFNQLQTNQGLYGEVGLRVEFLHQGNREILWSAMIQAREKAQGHGSEAVVLAVTEALENCILQILQQVKQVTAYHQASQ
jgi:ABC-type uncharacterized transport system auxiliary subunit